MYNDDLNSQTVVLVGGGFSGLVAALTLSNSKTRPKIILIEPKERFVFSPLLYEYLSGEINFWEVAPRYQSLIENRGIVLINDYVTKIDSGQMQVVTLSGLTIKYSKLVLSTGSQPNDYGIPGVLENSLMFNTLSDVALLRKLINDLKQFEEVITSLVIVGAGPSGVELACKVSDLVGNSIKIHLVERAHKVLPQGKAFNQEQIEKALTLRGINLHLQTEVLQIDEDKVFLKSIDDKDSWEFVLPYRGLLWTAGSQAVFPEIFPKPCLREGKIRTDSYLNAIGYENIMAIGDVSINDEIAYPATAQVAIQQGEVAAHNILASLMGGNTKSYQFKDFGEMLSLGIGQATIATLGLTIAGPIAFQIRRGIYLTKIPQLFLRIRSATSWMLGNIPQCQ